MEFPSHNIHGFDSFPAWAAEPVFDVLALG